MDKSASERILYGSHPPQSLIEEYEFSSSSPYFVRVKQPYTDDFALPHYSKDTIEILLCSGVTGYIIVDQTRYDLRPEQKSVHVMPPDTVHSTRFLSGGTVVVLQISLPHMGEVINLPAMLAGLGLRVADLISSFPEYDKVSSLVTELIENDHKPFACYRAIISLVEVLCASIRTRGERDAAFSEHSNAELKKIISWTNDNYHRQISLETMAGLVGMSRTYFCSWFKTRTNMTCTQYINQVRIANAVKLLAAGESVSSAALECGFANVSYFISVFKKLRGCTPREFSRRAGGK